MKKTFKSIVNFIKSQAINIRYDSKQNITWWADNLGAYPFNEVGEQQLLSDAFGGNPFVFMVVNRIAKTTATLEREFIDKTTGEAVEVPQELRDLLSKPNEIDTEESFLYRIYTNFLTTGQSFTIGKAPIGFTQYRNLCVPVPSNVQIIQDRFGFPLEYQYNFFNYSGVSSKEDVLHNMTPDIRSDSLRGFSTLQPMAKTWQSNNKIWESEAYFHDNKGISGVLYGDGNKTLTPKEQQALQNQYNTKHTGAKNFGGVMVNTTKLGFLQMGVNPADLKSIEARIDHLRAICAAFNVDSKLFGDPASSTYNNMQEATVAMILNAVLPLAKKIDDEISSWLIQDNFGLKNVVWRVNKKKISELNRPNTVLSDKIVSEVNAGIITTEEAKTILYPEL